MLPASEYREFDEDFELRKQISGSDAQRSLTYEAIFASGKSYFAKVYKPYNGAIDRRRLRRKGISLSDRNLDAYFNPFRRERRVYEYLDRHVTGPKRSFFPRYYGYTRWPCTALPKSWFYAVPDSPDNVWIIVLELLREPRPVIQEKLRLSSDLLSRAKNLRSLSNLDMESVHYLVHLYEIIDVLHEEKIIHSDIKPDMLADCSETDSPVLFDFSESWKYIDGIPRLDPFRRCPRTFEEDRKGELNAIDKMVVNDSKTAIGEKELRHKFPAIRGCGRCKEVVEDIMGKQ